MKSVLRQRDRMGCSDEEARNRSGKRRFLLQNLDDSLVRSDLFVTHQSARWLATSELPNLDARSLRTPAMQVLGSVVSGYEVGPGGSGGRGSSRRRRRLGRRRMLKALQEAIPVLYWETDERLWAVFGEGIGGAGGGSWAGELMC